MIWYTADLHFDHANVIRLCNRPFKTVGQMNKELIRRWNAVVEPDDTVIVAGDFSLRTKEHLGFYQRTLRKLRGRKILVLGNHDVTDAVWLVEHAGFQEVIYPYMESEGFVVCHDPALSEAAQDRWFLCGHVHTLFAEQRNVINVGVDVRDFTPISREELTQIQYRMKMEKRDV